MAMARSLVRVTVTALKNQYDPNASTSEAARRALAAAAGNSRAGRSASRRVWFRRRPMSDEGELSENTRSWLLMRTLTATVGDDRTHLSYHACGESSPGRR
jgi:hypothetical protein